MSENLEKIEIHADSYQDGDTGNQIGVAIVCAPTGVFCTVQANGTACDHPTVEGYAIALHSRMDGDLFLKALSELGDCEWGCNLKADEQLRMVGGFDWRLREDYMCAIRDFINNYLNDNIREYISFEFDWDRLGELMEGWWPVLIQFKNRMSISNEAYNTKFKGYLHFGNCD